MRFLCGTLGTFGELDPYSREYRSKVLEAFEQSGMSAEAFAKQCGLKYPTFASWVTKARKKKDRQRAPQPSGQRNENPAFLIAEVPSQTASTSLQIELPGGAILKITNSSQLPLATALLISLR
ncbi:hypothetical protein V2O64_25110 (plasmid) [Verrucomicrobiaceae bacterium 227]